MSGLFLGLIVVYCRCGLAIIVLTVSVYQIIIEQVESAMGTVMFSLKKQ